MPTELIVFLSLVLVIVTLLVWGFIRIEQLKADMDRDFEKIRRR